LVQRSQRQAMLNGSPEANSIFRRTALSLREVHAQLILDPLGPLGWREIRAHGAVYVGFDGIGPKGRLAAEAVIDRRGV
jgi:hypothetical protein